MFNIVGEPGRADEVQRRGPMQTNPQTAGFAVELAFLRDAGREAFFAAFLLRLPRQTLQPDVPATKGAVAAMASRKHPQGRRRAKSRFA